jgi:hypothetical protein
MGPARWSVSADEPLAVTRAHGERSLQIALDEASRVGGEGDANDPGLGRGTLRRRHAVRVSNCATTGEDA